MGGEGRWEQEAPSAVLWVSSHLGCGAVLNALPDTPGGSPLCSSSPDSSLGLKPRQEGPLVPRGCQQPGYPIVWCAQESNKASFSGAWERARHPARNAFMFCHNTLPKSVWINNN